MIKKIILLPVVIFFVLMTNVCFAETFHFQQGDSEIHGHIRYTVVGKYTAQFNQFQGFIEYDPEKQSIDRVTLTIKAASIQSQHSALDRIVKSRQILDVQSFPDIIFKSETVYSEDDHFRAEGQLTLHGVTQNISFPFNLRLDRSSEGQDLVLADGVWVIPRKEYGIIWNKLLDHGGVVVGNYITVDWRITAKKK